MGYLRKRVADRPDWLKAAAIRDVYSLSGCISESFADYVNFWRHNGYWLFDSPQVIEDLAQEHGIDLQGTTLFFYEVYEEELDEESGEWRPFTPEPSLPTAVEAPPDRHLEGFDVVTFWARTTPECSPLSCSLLAAELPVNEHCLFRTFEDAKQALDRGSFRDSEPGPYRIIAVYTVAG
jgi:hypothetical protein